MYQARHAFRSYRRGNADPAPHAMQPGENLQVYRGLSDAVWEDAYRVTEKLILVMRDEVQAKGAKFLVVTLSNGIQVNPDDSVREKSMQTFGVEDLFYSDHRIKSLGERENFGVLNLAPSLQSFAERNNVYLHGFGRTLGRGHWNADGHRVAGEIIAQRVCGGAEIK
jgi:hypothetical protein